MAEELLDLSTIVERTFITVTSKKHPKGKQYDIVDLDDLGVFEHQKIITLHASASKLIQSNKRLTAAQERQLSKALGDVVKIVLPGIEPAVLGELTNAQRSQIITVWSLRNAPASEEGKAPTATVVTGKPPRRTTGVKSRRSSGSTAATRKRGSTSRRG